MKHDPTAPERLDATLLVVDDNEDNRHILLQRLQREGYHHILQAADGVEAMELPTAASISPPERATRASPGHVW